MSSTGDGEWAKGEKTQSRGEMEDGVGIECFCRGTRGKGRKVWRKRGEKERSQVSPPPGVAGAVLTFGTYLAYLASTINPVLPVSSTSGWAVVGGGLELTTLVARLPAKQPVQSTSQPVKGQQAPKKK